MAKIELTPYLFFKGNCREAMEFYKSIFGGELTLQTIGEAPDFPGKENMNQKHVMHSMLSNGAVKIMASDSPTASPQTKKVELSLSGNDEAKLRAYWDGLSQDGKVNMPLEKAPWGDTFGMLSDKFGIDWMVNITALKE